MATIYYENSLKQWQKLSLDDINAAPRIHSHWSSALGIITQSQGGIQNESDIDLKTYTGPLLYYQDNKLDTQTINIDEGMYYFQNTDENYVHIGMPGWEQGAIPYPTEEEQLENMYRKIPYGASILFPRLIVTGMLSANGQTFYVPLKHNFILPPNANITLAGQYTIRQNDKYLFTSSIANDKTTWNYVGEYPIMVYNVPSQISANQTIITDDTEGWRVSSPNAASPTAEPYSTTGGRLRLERNSATPQTTAYEFKLSTDGATTQSCKGIAYASGVVDFFNLKLTFNAPSS